MSNLRAAAQQALEALEICAVRQEHQWHGLQQVQIVKAALRAALEQPEQEPVAWMTPGKDIITCNGAGTRFNDWIPLFTHPPRREWRGLTDQEIVAIFLLAPTQPAFARAIEAALRSKNHE